VTTVEASPASVSASVKRQIPPSFLLAALIVVMILMGILSLLDKMHFKG
jgi:hypothetical protein